MRDEGVLGDVVVVVPVGEAVVQAGLIDEIGEQKNRAEPEKPVLWGRGGGARGPRRLRVGLPGSWFRHGFRNATEAPCRPRAGTGPLPRAHSCRPNRHRLPAAWRPARR